MRILLITSAVEFGGAEQYLVELARELAGRGHQIAVAAPAVIADRFTSTTAEFGVETIVGAIEWAYQPEDGTGGTVYDAKVRRQREALAQILARASYGFAFVNANWPTHYAGVLAALCDARTAFGVHYHLCPHTIPLNPAARRIHVETLPQGSFRTTVSIATRFFMEQTFGRLLQFEVIPNGGRFVVDPKTHEALARARRRRILLSVGRLDYQKGFLDLVPAFTIPTVCPPYRLQILGEGPLMESLSHFVSQGAEAIEFLGQVDDVEKYMRRATGFVLPSYFEGMSLSILEAMSFGCIPIVSNASSAAELVTDGDNGFLFRVGDWRSFALAMDRFEQADKTELRWRCLRRSQLFSRAQMLGTMTGKIEAFPSNEHNPANRLSCTKSP